MSFELMRQVWQLELPRPQQHLLLAMADFANDDGRNCYPSHARLAWMTGYSVRQIISLIQELMASGLLVILAPATNKLPPHYWLRLDRGKNKPPMAPKTSYIAAESGGEEIAPQEEIRGEEISPPAVGGEEIARLEVKKFHSGGEKISPDPIINQSYNLPKKEGEALTPELWQECVTELSGQHDRYAEWLPGSELLPGNETRAGRAVWRLLVVNGKARDWLMEHRAAIVRTVGSHIGAKIEIDVTCELSAPALPPMSCKEPPALPPTPPATVPPRKEVKYPPYNAAARRDYKPPHYATRK